jgi:uncharacterized protein (TIGR03435 family)
MVVAPCLPSASLFAQAGAQSPGAPAFDVVSVKPSGTVFVMLTPGVVGTPPTRSFQYSRGRLSCKESLKNIIREAYQVKSWQVSGPDWLAEDAFEFAATMPADTSKETAQLMLRTMLADRFGLKFHNEQKDVGMFALVAAKGGFKLTEVETEGGSRSMSRPGSYSCDRITMSRLAAYLTPKAGRPVIDMTGLKGAYKIELRWSSDEASDEAGLLASLGQVGLHLEPQTRPYTILVIDHVERKPTPN